MIGNTTHSTSPVLPAEIMDVVIDQLCRDVEMLGICGLVCSEWLIRSRYHIFATVHLWPWRAHRFFELSHARECTFTQYVNCIEVDDARASRSAEQSADQTTDFPLQKIMSSSSFSRFSHIKALRIKNVDWTLIPPSDQGRLRDNLATLVQLKLLEFDDVMFHDLREITHITSLLPSLRHLVTNIQFSKYMEHVMASATSFALPNSLKSLRIGTDDAIPVLLNTTLKELRLNHLALDGVKFWHLQYIGGALRSLGECLRHFGITFAQSEVDWINGSDLANLDLIHQTKLRSLHISGMKLFNRVTSCALVTGIPPLILTLPPTNNLEELAICLSPESNSALRLFNWSALGRSITNHPRCVLYMDVDVSLASMKNEGETREYLLRELRKLRRERRLHVRLHSTARPY